MGDLENITSALDVVVACNHDRLFYDAMKDALLYASTAEVPLKVSKFLDKDEGIHAYIGIITVADDLTDTYNRESIAASMEVLMPQIAGVRESPLNTEKVLLCTFGNVPIIESFSRLHRQDLKMMLRSENPISFWGIARHNRTSRPWRKKTLS